MTPLEMTKLILGELHVDNPESEVAEYNYWDMDNISHYTITLRTGQQFHGILYGMADKEENDG
jgi:hypothetical protein